MPPQLNNGRGCTAWAVVALAAMLLLVGLLFYIDQRFGAEASAFFLGLSLGIPLLLIMVVIVGGIYVLVIRGTVHLQERDSAADVARMHAMGQVARAERALHGRSRPTAESASLIPSSRPALPNPDTPWPDDGWPQNDHWGEEPAPHSQGSGYRIVE